MPGKRERHMPVTDECPICGDVYRVARGHKCRAITETCPQCGASYKSVAGHRCKSPAGVDRGRFRPLSLREKRS